MKSRLLNAIILATFFADLSPAQAVTQTTISADNLFQCATAQTKRLNAKSVFQARQALSDVRSSQRPSLQISPGYDQSSSTLIDSQGVTYSIAVQQPIYNGALFSRVAAQNHAVHSAEGLLGQSALDVSRRAVDDLVTREDLREQIRLSEIRQQNFDKLGQSYTIAERAGLVNSIDLLQAKSAAINEKANLLGLKVELAKVEENFLTAYGFRAFDFAAITDVDAKGPEVAIEALPGISSLRSQVFEADSVLHQRRREIWPTLLLSGQYLNSKYSNTFETVQSHDLTVSLVFDFSGLWRESSARSAAARDADERRENLSQQLQATKDFYSQVDREIDALTEKIPALRERLDLANKAQSVGTVTLELGKLKFVDYQQLQETFSNANRDFILAQARFKQLKLYKALSSIATNLKFDSDAESCNLP